ncbi:MAG: hypothetical protein IPG63_04030 [Xanthomonadales bacterium]|nr:hypothetical protein [Xanthomonadales bacterium]
MQPSSLGSLKPGDCHIKLFAGEHQKKVDFALVQALQQFGSHAEYIQIVGNGKDALDFHIAFYIGRLSMAHPTAAFTIVSRDTGFDPLVKHVIGMGIACRRVAAISGSAVTKTPAKPGATMARASEKPTPKPAAAKEAATKTPRATANPTPTRLKEVLERLDGLKAARPGTRKALRSSLQAWFKPAPSEAEADALLDQLAQLGHITVTGNKLAYPARG